MGGNLLGPLEPTEGLDGAAESSGILRVIYNQALTEHRFFGSIS
jgi:hypothetical protein